MASERSLFDESCALIGLPVRVQLQDGTSTDGVLYCIDPETDHVALLSPTAQSTSDYSVKLLLAHHVRSIEKEPHESADLPTLADLEEKLRGDQGNGSRNLEDAERRREQLGQFLTKNFVPFQVATDGSVLVFGGATTLRAPFRSAQSANEQLLRRMQQLLAQFDQQQAATAQSSPSPSAD
ncbi:hypothetical protein PF005_g6401 [Phytophthora fragariae]|uniref:Uncharacterized protein n=1 Tax=Phytophthora fragariae TaxID=53985 RepID=A0A6A4A077_9STRA|nr:hypothetical protein PF009_g7115 [Phytophthora fragariae]KAE9020407.1 hypothetical protein PF011_g5427 [Phytophthora fragariae]KAE9124521.1 hypothetical protein PF007_g6686 [Phytophthora fragariae]KAE9125337.1 hypothetical protein PF010_g5656 [Phytophthora fragariae]KAE9149831.1 hypothetical protein PF006_g5734 [Phytophthora fragariae]